MTPFQHEVFDVVRTIPRGSTMTYAQVAERIGKPHSARAVGNALNKNYDPAIPCHRVVRSDGTTGGYNRGEGKKREKLEEEYDVSGRHRMCPGDIIIE